MLKIICIFIGLPFFTWYFFLRKPKTKKFSESDEKYIKFLLRHVKTKVTKREDVLDYLKRNADVLRISFACTNGWYVCNDIEAVFNEVVARF